MIKGFDEDDVEAILRFAAHYLESYANDDFSVHTSLPQIPIDTQLNDLLVRLMSSSSLFVQFRDVIGRRINQGRTRGSRFVISEPSKLVRRALGVHGNKRVFTIRIKQDDQLPPDKRWDVTRVFVFNGTGIEIVRSFDVQAVMQVDRQIH